MIVEGWKYSDVQPAELKIEVMWGAAYLGFWLGLDPYEKDIRLKAGVDRDGLAVHDHNDPGARETHGSM